MASVNASLMYLYLISVLNASGETFLETLSGGSFGDAQKTMQFPAKKGNETMIALGIDVQFLANSTANAVSGAVPSDVIDDLMIKVDSAIRVHSTETKALEFLSELMLDEEWSHDTLANNPSSVTYHSYIVVPINGRGGKNVTVDIDLGTYAKVYSADIVSLPVFRFYGIYSAVECPIFTSITKSHTFAGTGVSAIPISGDFSSGFLDTFAFIGDGTLVVDDIMFEDSTGRNILNGKYTARNRFTATKMRNVTQPSYSFFERINCAKPLDLNDKLNLDVSTIGSLKMGLLFKNESTTMVPESDAGGSTTPEPYNDDVIHEPSGEQPLRPPVNNPPFPHTTTPYKTGSGIMQKAVDKLQQFTGTVKRNR